MPLIVQQGGDWFAGIGTEESPGTALFALAGKLVNTGLAEVPMGTTLRTLVYDIGGGIKKGKKFKAVQIGGPSGAACPRACWIRLSTSTRCKEAGAIMGSGGVIVMDEDNCMVDTAKFFIDFSQQESCGKCTPCRIGTYQMLDILEDITNGKGTVEVLDTLQELAEDIKARLALRPGQDGAQSRADHPALFPGMSTKRISLRSAARRASARS